MASTLSNEFLTMDRHERQTKIASSGTSKRSDLPASFQKQLEKVEAEMARERDPEKKKSKQIDRRIKKIA